MCIRDSRRAQRPYELLVLLARQGRHHQSGPRRELHREPADHARGPGDQHRGTRGQVQQPHRPARGEPAQRERGGGRGVHGGRGGGQGRGVEHRVLGVRAQRLDRPVVQPDHLLPHAPAGHLRAELVDLAGHVPAEPDPLPGTAEDTHADRAVDRVDAGRPDPHADLAGLGAREGHLDDPDLLGAAEAVHDDRLHGGGGGRGGVGVGVLAHRSVSRSVRSLVPSFP